MSTAKTELDDATFFGQHGYLIVRAMFAADEVRAMKEAARAALAQSSPGNGVYVWFPPQIPAAVNEASCDSRVVAVLRRIAGQRMEFLSTKAVFKSGEVRYGSPWHQDRPYWGGSMKYSAWIALDDATPENGCMKVVPTADPQPVQHGAPGDPQTFSNRVEESRIPQDKVLAVPLAQGDVLFFHDLLLHASYPNTSGQDRWSLIATYRDAAIPDASTVWSRSTPLI